VLADFAVTLSVADLMKVDWFRYPRHAASAARSVTATTPRCYY
jgi:hypothetical protein